MESHIARTELFSLEGRRPLIFIIGAVFLIYAATIGYGLTWFDDNRLISGNMPLLSDPASLGRFFSSDVFVSGQSQFYRPLLNVSFMLDAILGGQRLAFFHLTNVLLHAAASCLVFRFLLRLGRERATAFALALAFACHPSLTQAVAWLPGRNDSLLCVFTLLAFLSLFRHAERASRIPFAGYLFFLLCALFTKESAVLIPAAAAFWLRFLYTGKLSSDRWLVFGAGSLAALALWFISRSYAFSPDSVSLGGTLGNLPGLIVMLRQALLPFSPEVWPVLGRTGLAGGAAAGLLLAAALAVSGAWRSMTARFGLLWFFIFSAPSLVNIGGDQETYLWAHRLYLPLPGLLLTLSELSWVKKADFALRRAAAPLAGLLLLFALASFRHARYFSDRLSFWERVTVEAPRDADIRLYLGYYYQSEGRPGDAERQYRAALELDPAKPFAHSNLASVYAAGGDLALAEAELVKELKVSPGSKQAEESLALVREALRSAPPRSPAR